MSIFSKRRRRDQVRQERPQAEGAAASGSDTWVLGQGEAGPTPVHHGGAGPVRSSPNGPEVPWPPGEQGAEQGPSTEEGTATDQDGGGSEGGTPTTTRGFDERSGARASAERGGAFTPMRGRETRLRLLDRPFLMDPRRGVVWRRSCPQDGGAIRK